MSPNATEPVSPRNPSSRKHFGNWRAFATACGASMAAVTGADAGIVYSGPVNLTISIPPSQGGAASAIFAVNGNNESLRIVYSSVLKRGFAAVLATSTFLPNLKFGRNTNISAKKYGLGARSKRPGS